MVNESAYLRIKEQLTDSKTTMVAVSKLKTADDVQKLYDLGHREFGENYVQELVDKYEALPKDIRWHFIGHLQSNKVKYIVPFVHLIQGVDSQKLLKEINRQAAKNGRQIDCLLQVHIADEQTKFGFDADELVKLEPADYRNVRICGLMGMATFTEDKNKVKSEFEKLRGMFNSFTILHPDVKESQFNVLSMGMSDDYELAVQTGSNMVRIGSLLFGRR